MNPNIWPPLPKISLVAIDPGETTGVVELIEGNLHRSYSGNYEWLLDALNKRYIGIGQSIWVVENFLIYPWKAEQLAFNLVVPAKLIGAIDLYLRNRTPRPSLI